MGLHADRNDQQATTYAVAERLSKNITLFLMSHRMNSIVRQIDLMQTDQLDNFSCEVFQKNLMQNLFAKQSQYSATRREVMRSASV